MAIERSPAWLAAMLALVLAEAGWRLARGRGYDGRAALTTLGLAAGNIPVAALNALAISAVFGLASRIAPVHWPIGDWRTWAAGFVAVEFAYYWFHRASHRVRWLWASHSVHHSAEQMTLARLAPARLDQSLLGGLGLLCATDPARLPAFGGDRAARLRPALPVLPAYRGSRTARADRAGVQHARTSPAAPCIQRRIYRPELWRRADRCSTGCSAPRRRSEPTNRSATASPTARRPPTRSGSPFANGARCWPTPGAPAALARWAGPCSRRRVPWRHHEDPVPWPRLRRR